jgi:hypothetical protein
MIAVRLMAALTLLVCLFSSRLFLLVDGAAHRYIGLFPEGVGWGSAHFARMSLVPTTIVLVAATLWSVLTPRARWLTLLTQIAAILDLVLLAVVFQANPELTTPSGHPYTALLTAAPTLVLFVGLCLVLALPSSPFGGVARTSTGKHGEHLVYDDAGFLIAIQTWDQGQLRSSRPYHHPAAHRPP